MDGDVSTMFLFGVGLKFEGGGIRQQFASVGRAPNYKHLRLSNDALETIGGKYNDKENEYRKHHHNRS